MKLYGLQVCLLERNLKNERVQSLIEKTDIRLITHFIHFGFLPNQVWNQN